MVNVLLLLMKNIGKTASSPTGHSVMHWRKKVQDSRQTNISPANQLRRIFLLLPLSGLSSSFTTLSTPPRRGLTTRRSRTCTIHFRPPLHCLNRLVSPPLHCSRRLPLWDTCLILAVTTATHHQGMRCWRQCGRRVTTDSLGTS